jgi:hypothetical protein
MTEQLFPAHIGSLSPDPTADGWASNWQDLADRLGKLPEERARRWRIAVGLLCTPEMGWPEPPGVNLIPPELAGQLMAGRTRRKVHLPPSVAALVKGPTNQRRAAQRPPGPASEKP